MKLLLDTHILLSVAGNVGKLKPAARRMLESPDNELIFSAASLWEVTIKRGLGRNDFQVDPYALRRGLLDNEFTELAITSAHAVAVETLPMIHKNPFDRILIAQAMVEGMTLLTRDLQVSQYPGRIQRI